MDDGRFSHKFSLLLSVCGVTTSSLNIFLPFCPMWYLSSCLFFLKRNKHLWRQMFCFSPLCISWCAQQMEDNEIFNAFLKQKKRIISALWCTIYHSIVKVMSVFEMEATSNKNFKLREKMSSVELKAVVLLGANTIYCFKKCSKW